MKMLRPGSRSEPACYSENWLSIVETIALACWAISCIVACVPV